MRRRTLLQGGDGLVNISSATVTAASQTYDGVAKTPAVAVTLFGETLSSEFYDVSYSNNINAGTATITVTGKGDYTGTATGTFTIARKSLSITASSQTITYGSSIATGTGYVSVSGLVSGDSLTLITLWQSTSAVGTGYITPSDAQTTNGISNYSVTYHNGTLTVNKAAGSIAFAASSCVAGYDGGTTGTIYVRTSGSGWVETTEKAVSGHHVFRSVSNWNRNSSYSVMKLTFVNNTGASVSTTVKVGKAMEGSFDYPYIANWDAADITSNAVPSSVIYTAMSKTAEWTDVAITIPAGTHTLQVVYRKDGSVSNSPDCGYFAMPYGVSMSSLVGNAVTYTGSGSLSYSSSNTAVATVNSNSGAVTIAGTGTATITVSMASNTNYTEASASYTLTVNSVVPVGAVKNFAYSGSYQETELSDGQYKLQCWGAQGGSNAAASSYGITAQAGGKGGYSEGIITLASKTKVRVYVGGAGSSSAGGFNGGGSTTGSSSYSSGDTQGVSRMGGGGGATDIRLSDGALLSRMIVAGGGSGGAMCYQNKTTSTEKTQTVNWQFYDYNGFIDRMSSHSTSAGNASFSVSSSSVDIGCVQLCLDLSSYTFPVTVSFNVASAGGSANLKLAKAVNRTVWSIYSSEIKNAGYTGTGTKTVTLTDSTYPVLFYYCSDNKTSMSITSTVRKYTEPSTTTANSSQVGYAGGGTTGAAYSSTYQGKQNGAGTNGSFGQGANQTATNATNYRYCSGAGGGGWYGGGGGRYSDSDMNYCKQSGGGSGWVNIAANASYRPSGYTGLQLDSGETRAGNTSFPNTAGTGNETGHSGNGYARITRIA